MAPWVLTNNQNVPIDSMVTFPECTWLEFRRISSGWGSGREVVFRAVG